MATPMLKRLAFRFGYDFTLRKLPQYALKSREMRVPRDMESEFIEMYERVRAKTLTSVESLYSLYQAVGHVVDNDIEGDFVECGVWRGGSCMLMALALAARGDTERRIYLYDTFTGMPEPGDFDVRLRDGTPQKERWKTFDRGDHNEWCYASFEEVGANMASTGYPAEQVVMVKGDVTETIPRIAPERIALLRLDTDWYESTDHELRVLYPRLERHGVLIVDDYGAYAGSRKATDEFFAENGAMTLLHRIDTSARIGVKLS